MTTIKKFILSFLFVFFPVLSYASSSVGTTAVPFLKYGAGARAAGMGSAFSAVTGAGSDMIYWNPAGIASINRQDVSLMYLSGFEGISYGWASYAMPSVYGSFGGAIQYLSSGKQAGTDIFGSSTSDFSTYDFAISFSYAKYYDLGKAGILDYGLNLKYIYSKLDTSADAFAVDAGAIFTLADNVTSIGAVLQNVGTNMKYNEEDEVLPFVARVGVSRIFIKNLLVAFDINFPNDNDIFPSFGAEYSINIMQDADIAIRAGYDGRQKDIDGFSRINAGFGLKYRDYIFDYAFSPYGNLGDVHRVSLGIKFGEEFDAEAAYISLKEKRETESAQEAVQQRQRPAEQSSEKQSSESPEGFDEDYGAASGNYEFEEESEVQLAVRPVRQTVEDVAIVNFISQKIPQNELKTYAQMLEKRLFETGAFSAFDAQKVQSIYSGNAAPEESDIRNIFKFTKVEKVIVCSVVKRGDNIVFNISVYDTKLRIKKYNITCRHSFRYANETLEEFARQLAEETN
ncbi:MAG: PorV/PorQ family protein [Endomicrobium sp.]|jgi:hypothetical protein|nr:PorV/PorQ family protein [Endomicrobium sp.]